MKGKIIAFFSIFIAVMTLASATEEGNCLKD